MHGGATSATGRTLGRGARVRVLLVSHGMSHGQFDLKACVLVVALKILYAS